MPARVLLMRLALAGAAAWLMATRAPTAQEFEPAGADEYDAARLAALGDALDDGAAYLPGELLVRFRPGVDRRAQASALRSLRSEVGADNGRWVGDVLHLRRLDLDDPLHAAALLERQPEVLYAQPNYLRRLASRTDPNDTHYRQQWQFETINLPTAWEISPGGRPEVLVAVLDTGLTTATGTYAFRLWTGRAFQGFPVPLSRAADFDHTRIRPGREFVMNMRWRTPAGDPMLFDADGHGTHVAGTIAQQTNNAFGYAGVAHAVSLLPLKVCWSYWDLRLWQGHVGMRRTVDPMVRVCPDDAQVQAVRYAVDQGAKVINMSIAGERPSPAMADALRSAVHRGALVVVAAGNQAREGNPTMYPAAYARTIDGVVAVGAVSRSLQRAWYSGHGPHVEIVAPGGDGGAQVNDVWQVGPEQSDREFCHASPRFDRYQNLGMSGTSMAAPHVSGVAALLVSAGMRDPALIEAVLARSARDLGTAGRDDEYGHGLLDARTALALGRAETIAADGCADAAMAARRKGPNPLPPDRRPPCPPPGEGRSR